MDNCKDGKCTYLARWQHSGNNDIEFELQYTTAGNGDSWAAIAFSSTAAMVCFSQTCLKYHLYTKAICFFSQVKLYDNHSLSCI